jgi:hypothetical protein
MRMRMRIQQKPTHRHPQSTTYPASVLHDSKSLAGGAAAAGGRHVHAAAQLQQGAGA